MSFKIHLIIVSVITIVIFVIMQIFTGKKEPEVQATPTSPYTITIERASWGLNCRMNNNDRSDTYMQQSDSENRVKENNVISAVSKLCNVRPKCEIAVDSSVLGDDPLPNCGFKELKIEYRCFSVDRMRVVKQSEGTINIDCDKQFSNQ